MGFPIKPYSLAVYQAGFFLNLHGIPQENPSGIATNLLEVQVVICEGHL